MKGTKRIFKTLLVVACLIVSVAAGSSRALRLNYAIDSASKLLLSGTSNVSDYSCNCNTLIQTQKEMQFEENKGRLLFSNASLKLQTKGFDCGMSIITREMHSALKAKTNPNITVQLLNVDISKSSDFLQEQNKSYTANGKAKITIAGRSKLVNLKIIAHRLKDQEFHFSGTKHLKMTDFGIDPPTFAMGLIKVGNEVIIELDLKARVTQ